MDDWNVIIAEAIIVCSGALEIIRAVHNRCIDFILYYDHNHNWRASLMASQILPLGKSVRRKRASRENDGLSRQSLLTDALDHGSG